MQSFLEGVPRIRMYDPLASFLGASEGGVLEYAYGDAVKLAGHSCPTLAGAWLMTRRGLLQLYGDALPERGAIRVELSEARSTGVTGVIANVAGLITGAAGDGGFKGIAGRFARCGLLSFEAPIRGCMRFTRLDSGAACEVDYRPELVPVDPRMPALLRDALGDGTGEAQREFARLWQERVRRILIDHADDPRLVPVEAARARPA